MKRPENGDAKLAWLLGTALVGTMALGASAHAAGHLPPTVDIDTAAPALAKPVFAAPVLAPSAASAYGRKPLAARHARLRRAAAPLPVARVCTLIEASAKRNGLPPAFLARLIWTESRFRTRAVSSAGAMGIAQFMPTTARSQGLLNPFDPASAIEASARHLARMRRDFGSLGLAAIGYNAGRSRAARHREGQGVLPSETRAYVVAVLGRRATDYRGSHTYPVAPLHPILSFREACRRLPVMEVRNASLAVGPVPTPRPGASGAAEKTVKGQTAQLATIGTGPSIGTGASIGTTPKPSEPTRQVMNRPAPATSEPAGDATELAPKVAKPEVEVAKPDTAPVAPKVDTPAQDLPAVAIAPAPKAATGIEAKPSVEPDTKSQKPEQPRLTYAQMRLAARQLKVAEVCSIIRAAADRQNLPPAFLARLIWKESRFDVRAVSPVGALGIAQFMPATAKLEGLANPFDPVSAIHASAKHLADMRREFGNLGLAAIGYNAGRGRAQKFTDGDDWLPAETVDYVASILGRNATEYADGNRTYPVEPLKKGLSFEESCLKLPVIRTRAAGLIPGQVKPRRQPWHVQISRHFAKHVAVNMAKKAQRRFPQILGKKQFVVVIERGAPGLRDQKSVRVGAPSRTAAMALCNRLRKRGGFCLVKKNRRFR